MIQEKLANDMIDFLSRLKFVHSCKIHGSLSTSKHDHMSDIDLLLDVSGHNNAQILLMLPYIIEKKYSVAYYAFTPKLAPEVYLLSFALSNTDIFHYIDIECFAFPHHSSLFKQDILLINNNLGLLTKLLIGCLKRKLRKQDFSEELYFLAGHMDENIKLEPTELLYQCFQQLHRATAGEHQAILTKCLKILETSQPFPENQVS